MPCLSKSWPLPGYVIVWHYRWTTVHACLCTHPRLSPDIQRKLTVENPSITPDIQRKLTVENPSTSFIMSATPNIVKHKMYTNNWPAWTRWTAGTSVQASPWVRKMITDHEHWSVSPRIRSKITGITSNKNHNSNHRALKHDYKWNHADRE